MEARGGAATADEIDTKGRGLGGLSGAAARLSGSVIPVLRYSLERLLLLLGIHGTGTGEFIRLEVCCLLHVIGNHLKVLDVPSASETVTGQTPFASAGGGPAHAPFMVPGTEIAVSAKTKAEAARATCDVLLVPLVGSELFRQCSRAQHAATSRSIGEDLMCAVAGIA